jgi:hypothetical protein
MSWRPRRRPAPLRVGRQTVTVGRLAGEFQDHQNLDLWVDLFEVTARNAALGTPLSVSQPSPERTEPSPNAERLRIAMGWNRLPEMSPERAAEFEVELARHDEEVSPLLRQARRVIETRVFDTQPSLHSFEATTSRSDCGRTPTTTS